MYREVNGYPHVVTDTVEQNPDELTAEERHHAAWPIIARRFQDRANQALAQMADLAGTGRASTNPAVVGRRRPGPGTRPCSSQHTPAAGTTLHPGRPMWSNSEPTTRSPPANSSTKPPWTP